MRPSLVRFYDLPMIVSAAGLGHSRAAGSWPREVARMSGYPHQGTDHVVYVCSPGTLHSPRRPITVSAHREIVGLGDVISVLLFRGMPDLVFPQGRVSPGFPKYIRDPPSRRVLLSSVKYRRLHNLV